jgi:hypothetical protein
MFKQILSAAILAVAIAPATLLTAFPTLAQSTAAQGSAAQGTAPATGNGRTPAPAPTTAPARLAPTLNSDQLNGCQSWASRALENVPRTSIEVAPGTALLEGVNNVQWRVRSGTDHGFCLVRRDGTVVEAVRYANGTPLHYFPNGNDIGTPVE